MKIPIIKDKNWRYWIMYNEFLKIKDITSIIINLSYYFMTNLLFIAKPSKIEKIFLSISFLSIKKIEIFI